MRIRKSIFLAVCTACILNGCGLGSKNPPGPASNPAKSQVPADRNSTEPAAPGPAKAPQAAAPAPTGAPAALKPTVEHIVIVVEENHSYNQIVGNQKAPYFNQLIADGALYTNSFAVAHPSQPNYLALFSGSTQGIKDDSCGKSYDTANLASELIGKKLTFTGYSEDLPRVGYNGCSAKGYARKHNPWVQFANVPTELNQPLTAFPKDFSKLPSVSFVIPNHQDDMHDGTIEQADKWIEDHLSSYVTWAAGHRSLLVVTWDEDDNSKNNHIPTIFVGPMVKPGQYTEKINHYHVLRTIEDLFQLPPLGESAKVEPLTSLWKP